MCFARFRIVLLCFGSILFTSCKKVDSPVDAALTQTMVAMHDV
jgi:hypothetical protein